VAACVSVCGVCTGCCAACDSVTRCTAPSTHTTCSHNTKLLTTMYFYWLLIQKCNFSKAQCKLPKDGPNGPKHVGANIRYFILYFIYLIKCTFVGKEEFWRYRDARYNDKKYNIYLKHKRHGIFVMLLRHIPYQILRLCSCFREFIK
jgi:hypothetical protein